MQDKSASGATIFNELRDQFLSRSVCDNYSTHKHAKVKAWLAKHPRVHVHFTPTSASWLNMVERFFRDITEKCIRRGVFHSVSDLEEKIPEYISIQNEGPSPFIWTAEANDILEKVKRARQTVDNLQSAKRATLAIDR